MRDLRVLGFGCCLLLLVGCSGSGGGGSATPATLVSPEASTTQLDSVGSDPQVDEDTDTDVSAPPDDTVADDSVVTPVPVVEDGLDSGLNPEYEPEEPAQPEIPSPSVIDAIISSLSDEQILNRVSQGAPSSYDVAKPKLTLLHQQNQSTLYCGCQFDSSLDVSWDACGFVPRLNSKGNLSDYDAGIAARIWWEHIVPASWIGGARGCWAIQ